MTTDNLDRSSRNALIGMVRMQGKICIVISPKPGTSPDKIGQINLGGLVDTLAPYIDKQMEKNNFPRSQTELWAKLDIPIASLDFDNYKGVVLSKKQIRVRLRNVCETNNVFCVGDLVQRTEQEVRRWKHFGDKSIMALQEILKSDGLSFGMSPDELMGWSRLDRRAAQ